MRPTHHEFIAEAVYIGNYTFSYTTAPSTVIYGYCVDIQDSPTSNPTSYVLQPITAGTPYAAAAWILSQGFSGTQAQEAQAAVWELVWDYGASPSNPYSLTSGNFQLTGMSGMNATDFAAFTTGVGTIYADALAALPTFDPSGFVLVHSDDYQDFVGPVPVPPSALLLGAGLLGLVGLGWRRRKVS